MLPPRTFGSALSDTNSSGRPGKRRRVPAYGKENEKDRTASFDESKAPHEEAQDARGHQASVQDVGLHEVQNDIGAQDEKDDTSEDNVVQCEEGQEGVQADYETESECELSRTIFYLTGNGSADCSEAL
ncbi:hypothetical protein BGZ76_002537 [Entomortierella beljakovae]|nr:hypothetical protein BGZ76_002537 [Entomortierella beljakovae]